MYGNKDVGSMIKIECLFGLSRLNPLRSNIQWQSERVLLPVDFAEYNFMGEKLTDTEISQRVVISL